MGVWIDEPRSHRQAIDIQRALGIAIQPANFNDLPASNADVAIDARHAGAVVDSPPFEYEFVHFALLSFSVAAVGSTDFLPTQVRLVEHLDHDAIRVSAIKGGAAVSVNLEGLKNPDALDTKFRFQFFDSLDSLNDESEMIELLFGETGGIWVGYLMKRHIVTTRGEIDVLCIWFPDDVHAEKFLIKL